MNDQTTIPCVLMRAGTSKGPFLHARDLPPHGPARDEMLLRLMGSPDLIQIDGLGGSRPITSKIAIVSPSTRDDADVDYLFAQVDIDSALVSYAGNCGNISSGVGPFAIDEGLVAPAEPNTRVRIYNVNTGKILTAIVQVHASRARVSGDYAIPGVPGTGAEIVLDYTATTGAKTGKLLPTGGAQDIVTLDDGRAVRFTLVDMGNPCIWVPAEDLGLSGDELADRIDGNERLLATVKEIRGKVAAMIGMIAAWQEVDPGLPMLGFVSSAGSYDASNGTVVTAAEVDLRVRLLFMGRMHESLAGTASVSLAAASRVPGSVVAEVTTIEATDTLRAGHPLGSMHVKVVATAGPDGGVRFDTVGFSRTARRLMSGVAYLPR